MTDRKPKPISPIDRYRSVCLSWDLKKGAHIYMVPGKVPMANMGVRWKKSKVSNRIKLEKQLPFTHCCPRSEKLRA